MSRLHTGEWVAGAGGLATLLGLFLLDWYGHGGGSVGAWDGQGPLGTIANLVILAAAVLAVAVPLTALTLPASGLPVAIAAISALIAWLACGCVVGRILWRPGPGFSLGLELGIVVTMAGAAACFIGSFVAMRDEGPGN